jgi:O-methyltransferase
MFYGNFTDSSDREFKETLQKLRRIFGVVYAADNLIALQRTAGFLRDAQFNAAMARHAQSAQEKSLAWRLHTLTWAAEHCLGIDGDFVECGVFRGFSSAVIAEFLRFETVAKTFYLYDTFEGIPEEYNSENRSNAPYETLNAHDRHALYKHVRGVFARYANVRIVKGVIPHAFDEAFPERIAFLHIDLNSVKSEIAALEALFDRVARGGMIVFDDYGWSGYVQQKIAEDAFAAARGHRILELPTGQGLLIRK